MSAVLRRRRLLLQGTGSSVPAPPTFLDCLKSDAAEMITADEFGESIIYLPHQQTEKTIDAVIDRSPARPMDIGGRTFPQKVIELWVVNSATGGVSSVKERFDRVCLPINIGGDTVTLRVNKVISQDDGVWHLEAVE